LEIKKRGEILTILSEENINQYRSEQFVRDLTAFHNTKISIQGNHINIIQKSLQKLKNWRDNNELNNVPDLTNVDNDLQNTIENILYEEVSENFLKLLGTEFSQTSGLKLFSKTQKTDLEIFIEQQKTDLEQFINNQTINSKFLQTLKDISINIIHNSLKETLSNEEFELGYQIYKLETKIPKDFFNLFINSPGIDNFPFNVEEVDVNDWEKITSTSRFLEHLNQIGLTEDLKFDYTSERFRYYNLSTELQNQSFQIRDQLYMSTDKINQSLETLRSTIYNN